MDNHEFEDLGKKIQDIVDNAVNSNSYHELSHTINQTVNKAIDSGSEALKNALNSVFDPGADPEFRKKSYTYQSPYYGRSRKAKQQAARKQSELLYGKTTGENLKGMMMAVSGGILLSGMGLGAMVLLIWMGIGHSGALAAGVLGVMCAGAAGGGALLGAGTSRLGRLGRFQKYIRALGDHTYCNFQKLAQAAGKNEKFVKKDIRFMIQKGWFLEGQTDQKETCLITSTETYRQYTETQKALEQRNEEECRKRQQETEQQKQISTEVQEVLDTMQKDMLERARAHRDAHTYVATDYEEFKDTINNKPGFVKAMWCGNRECEDKIKEDVQATSRCMPFEQEHLSDVCVCCGKPAKKMVYWGRAY